MEGVDEQRANEVVELLRARHVFASVSRRTGVYSFGIRVVIPDGREALWDNDGAAGLEAMVLRDGVLVGFVPTIPDTDELEAHAIADLIAATDYDAPAADDSGEAASAAPAAGASAPPPAGIEAEQPRPPAQQPPSAPAAQRRWLRRR